MRYTFTLFANTVLDDCSEDWWMKSNNKIWRSRKVDRKIQLVDVLYSIDVGCKTYNLNENWRQKILFFSLSLSLNFNYSYSSFISPPIIWVLVPCSFSCTIIPVLVSSKRLQLWSFQFSFSLSKQHRAIASFQQNLGGRPDRRRFLSIFEKWADWLFKPALSQ